MTLIMPMLQFYKSTNFGISQVPSDPNGGNQKEKFKTLTFLHKVIWVVDSYASEAREHQAIKSKALFKYTPKDKKGGPKGPDIDTGNCNLLCYKSYFSSLKNQLVEYKSVVSHRE